MELWERGASREDFKYGSCKVNSQRITGVSQTKWGSEEKIICQIFKCPENIKEERGGGPEETKLGQAFGGIAGQANTWMPTSYITFCTFRSWPLHFQFSFLLMYPGRQQMVAQVLGSLTPKREAQMEFQDPGFRSKDSEKWPSRWRFFSPTPFPCHSAFQGREG